MTAEFVAGARNQPRRPGERRDPYRVISLVGAVAETVRHHTRRWLWVPAFAVFDQEPIWWIAGLAGALMGVVWNYAMSGLFVWRKR